MKPTRHTSRRAVMALALCGGFAVQGCAGGMPMVLKPRMTAPEQVVVPQTAPLVAEQTATAQTVRPPAKKPATAARSAVAIPKRENIALNVSYLERILVPIGSDLTLRATGDGSGPPSVKSTKVKSGPPYSIDMPVDTGEGAYPMTVQATLTSTIGHVLAGSVTLTEKPTGPVEIIMHTKTE